MSVQAEGVAFPSGAQTPSNIRPVLQVGLIGHRHLDAQALVDLRMIARDALAKIRTTAVAAAGNDPAGGGLDLRCVCGLAEGADVILADEALAQGYALSATIPFHRDEYLKDFETDAARADLRRLLDTAQAVYELDGTRSGSLGYQAVGRLLLEQSDLLVAIWDGRPALGPRGTGQILHEAWLADVPAIIIAAQAPHELRVFDPLAGHGAHDIASVVDRMLRYQPTIGAKDGLARFLQEDVADWGSRSRPAPSLTAPQTRPDEEGDTPGSTRTEDAAMKAVATQIDKVLGPHFAIADRLAFHYGRLYRVSNTVRTCVALPSTLGALMAFYGAPAISRLGFLIQLVTLGGSLGIYAFDRKAEWHRRFLDYRFLAEHLRNSRTMAFFGSTAALPRLPAHLAGGAGDWVAFRLRATIRSLGLVSAKVGPEYLAAVRRAVDAEISGQIDFYESRVGRYERRGKALQWLGLSLYALGILFVVLRASMAVAGQSSGDAYTVMAELALVVPSAAPVFFSLRSQAEYNRLSQRYASMATQLRRIREGLASDDVRRNRVERMAREMSHVLLGEVSDWRLLIKAHDLTPF